MWLGPSVARGADPWRIRLGKAPLTEERLRCIAAARDTSGWCDWIGWSGDPNRRSRPRAMMIDAARRRTCSSGWIRARRSSHSCRFDEGACAPADQWAPGIATRGEDGCTAPFDGPLAAADRRATAQPGPETAPSSPAALPPPATAAPDHRPEPETRPSSPAALPPPATAARATTGPNPRPPRRHQPHFATSNRRATTKPGPEANPHPAPTSDLGGCQPGRSPVDRSYRTRGTSTSRSGERQRQQRDVRPALDRLVELEHAVEPVGRREHGDREPVALLVGHQRHRQRRAGGHGDPVGGEHLAGDRVDERDHRADRAVRVGVRGEQQRRGVVRSRFGRRSRSRRPRAARSRPAYAMSARPPSSGTTTRTPATTGWSEVSSTATGSPPVTSSSAIERTVPAASSISSSPTAAIGPRAVSSRICDPRVERAGGEQVQQPLPGAAGRSRGRRPGWPASPGAAGTQSRPRGVEPVDPVVAHRRGDPPAADQHLDGELLEVRRERVEVERHHAVRRHDEVAGGRRVDLAAGAVQQRRRARPASARG